MRRSPLGLLIVAGPVVVLVIGLLLFGRGGDTISPGIPPTGPFAIALAGDVLVSQPLGPMERDPGFVAVGDIVRGAHFAAANLDMNLLDEGEARRAEARPGPRWPSGSVREARTLKALGFDAISLANDHATDNGSEGLASTIRILKGVGLLHAGTGESLDEARAPAFSGSSAAGGRAGSTASGRVALIAVAASSFAESRATRARGDISARAGLSPLRYTADITVDPATFQTLKESMAVLNAGPPAAAGELTMFGTPIRRGDRTVVEFRIEASDEREILEAVKTARAAAEIVVVSLHSHEPSNAVEQPADFAMRFARSAIDAGAAIVVGHGPHRLRGVEMYRQGAILYSLGNFLYQTAGLDFRAANMYDQGANLYQAAVGGVGEPPRAVATPPGADEWWEGLLALATVDQGRVNEIRLYPLDLGVDKSLAERGIPRIARGTQAERILTRLRQASDPFPARVEAEPETGTVRVVSPITSAP